MHELLLLLLLLHLFGLRQIGFRC